MNGYSSRITPPYGFNAGMPTPVASLNSSPAPKRPFEAYRKDPSDAPRADKSRLGSMYAANTQSSALVDLQDPIQVHLLTETALLDSKQFEIISQEEVDDLKKQCQSLSQRIEQTRLNLTIQAKYRDAAISMSKLYMTARPEGRRRSLLNRNSNSGGGSGVNVKEAEAERIASERRCDELSVELSDLEKRLVGLQRRLLQHTAGILQLTHKASKNKAKANGLTLNGIPGSPESLYTYPIDRDDDFLDFDGMMNGGKRPGANIPNTIEIPMRSPIRAQTRELKEESERLMEENQRLHGEIDMLQLEKAQRPQLPPGTEERLRELSDLVRQTVVRVDPDKHGGFEKPPNGPLSGYLNYLETGLGTLRTAQDLRDVEGPGQANEAAIAQAGDIIGQIHRLMDIVNPEYPLPRDNTRDLDSKLAYLETALRLVQGEAIKAIDGAKLMAAERQDNADIEHLLGGLWDSIQNSLVDAKRRREQRRAAGQLDDDVSGDEMMDTEEEYSLAAFASKVRYITSKASDLRENKTVLHRQIRQQRELNSKLTADGEADLMRMQDELDQARRMLKEAQNDAADAHVRLDDALSDAERAQNSRAANESQAMRDAQTRLAGRDAAMSQLEASRRELQNRITQLEDTVEELSMKLAKAETNLVALDGQLADTAEARRFVENELEKRRTELEAKAVDAESKEREIRDKNEELEKLNDMFIETKTELTFAQAELDRAHGSRSERAKQAAAIKSSAQVGRLESQVADLKSQLAGTVDELQQMTKETMGAERERMGLETKLDDALAMRSTLENECRELRNKLDQELENSRVAIARLRDELDTEKIKSAPTGRGATMLSEQFRATMREERKKFQEELREEQSKRRKMEEELAKLRREMPLKR